MGRLHLIDSPYTRSLLTLLRDSETGRAVFVQIMEELGHIAGTEVYRFLEPREKKVVTPLGAAWSGVDFPELGETVIVSVLRASAPFTWGMLRVLPGAKVGFVGAKRVEGKRINGFFEVEINYFSVPKGRVYVIADPMLATASTIYAVLDRLRVRDEKVIVASVIASEEGVRRVLLRDEVRALLTFSVDPGLDEKGFIVPGLGDAGDRCCG